MKIRKILGLLIVIGAVLGLCIPVLADSYSWWIPIYVTEYGGTSRTGIPIVVDLNVQGLVTMDYLDSSGLDSRMRESGYDRPYTLEGSKVGLVVYSLTGYQSSVVNLYTGYSPVGSDFDLVVGPSGYVTISDSADLELGDSFEIEQKGFINTESGANKNLIFKDVAFKTYISATGNITSAIYTGGGWNKTVTATGVDSGIHTVKTTGNTTHLQIFIDGEEEDSVALSGASVPDENGDYIIMQNESLLSLEFMKVSP